VSSKYFVGFLVSCLARRDLTSISSCEADLDEVYLRLYIIAVVLMIDVQRGRLSASGFVVERTKRDHVVFLDQLVDFDIHLVVGWG